MTETPGAIGRIVLASGNPGKLQEIQALLAPLNLELMPQTCFDFPEVEENGLSFVENALLKARHACHHTGLPAIADDSGLEVDALQGQPGIYSSRYAGEETSDRDNLEKLLADLAGVPTAQRRARFQCLMVYLAHEHDPTPLICQGTWEGYILEKSRGAGGFGYDPVFYVPTHDCASAELPAAVKNRLSHRGQALQCLMALLGAR